MTVAALAFFPPHRLEGDRLTLAYRLELENVSKHYGNTRALESVSVAIPSGKIRGLVGENGAGKSTLSKIIAGDIRPTSGTMKLNGAEVPYLTPTSARRAGIAIVHQWGDLVPAMTVEENIFLGNEIHGSFRILNKSEMRRRAREVLNELGVDVDPDKLTDDREPAVEHHVIVGLAEFGADREHHVGLAHHRARRGK